MNKRSTQPRKSSTNTRTLSTRVANIEQNTSPKVTFTSLRGNPPPVSNSYKTIKRRVFLSAATNPSATSVFDVGDVSTALTGLSGDFMILRADCYGTDPTARNYSPATFTLVQKNIVTNGSSTNQLEDVVVKDYGTSSSCPGVAFHVPKARAMWIAKDTASTVGLIQYDTACYVVLSVLQQINA